MADRALHAFCGWSRRPIVVAVVVAGCSHELAEIPPARPPGQPAPAAFSALPVVLTVKQRSTTAIPGSDGRVTLTIDDITRGQVMTSLASRDGRPIMAWTSLRPGESVTFLVDGRAYVLKLTELNNALIGEDFATFAIQEAGDSTLTEREKIDRLIQHVAGLSGAVFLRNGARHAPEEAAEHLRAKLAAADGDAMTARRFIDHIGTESSRTGEPYAIILPDGSSIPSREFLLRELLIIESKPNHDGPPGELAR